MAGSRNPIVFVTMVVLCLNVTLKVVKYAHKLTAFKYWDDSARLWTQQWKSLASGNWGVKAQDELSLFNLNVWLCSTFSLKVDRKHV